MRPIQSNTRINDMQDSKAQDSLAKSRPSQPGLPGTKAQSPATLGETSMHTCKHLFQAGLLLLAIAATASAQMQFPMHDASFGYGAPMDMGASAGYYGSHGGSGHGAGHAELPILGPTMFSLNGSVDGFGFQGNYASAATTIPLGQDSLHGWWLIDGRASLSDRGQPFFNVGLVRRTHFRPMNADFGVGLFYDLDADEYENFGHTFHQIGVSAHMWTPYFDVNFNGYMPLGPSSRTVGTADSCFFENFVLLRHGIDSALEGFEFDFGIRPPSWQQHNGTINLGVYAFGSDAVDNFAGFSGSYSFQPKPGMRLAFGMTTDEEFDPSGLIQVEFWKGRSRGNSPSGRGLDPIRRFAHIIRQHQDPVFLTSPDTGERIRVVHVDNSAPEGGNGYFESPYNELEDADGTLPPHVDVDIVYDIPRSLPGDIIFVHEGLSRRDVGTLTPDDPTDDTPLDPTDDIPGDLTGYDTGINLLAGQQLLGDGVEHIIATREAGNFALCNDIDGFTPFISNPNGAAVTLADNTTVAGFGIVNAKTGILAPDPTPVVNNGDGVAGNVVIRDTTIYMNDPVINPADFDTNTGDAADPDILTLRAPLEYGINIQDSTATYTIDQVDIVGFDTRVLSSLVDPAGAGGRTIAFDVQGELIAAINVERGSPSINFEGTIDNRINILEDVVLDDGDPATVDPTVFLNFATFSAGGAAVQVARTTGGNRVYNGVINNFNGDGVFLDENMNGSDVFNCRLTITDPNEFGVRLTDNTNQNIAFNNLLITTPTNEAALAAAVAAGNPFNPLPVAGFVAERNNGGLIAARGQIDIVGGPALIVAAPDTMTTPIDMTFTTLRSRNSLDGGVELANASGRFQADRTLVMDSAGTAITVAGADTAPLVADFGQVVISASLDAAGNPQFAQGAGVIINNNAMGTTDFTTLNITTTQGLGFQAIDGGTVNFITAPIIAATGGAAVDIENTIGQTNGVAGFTFESLTSINSADEGVRLVDMVSDFLVRGDTTIQDNSGFGIEVARGNAVIIDFNEVNIISRNNVGVQINDVAGVVKFANVDIDSNLDNMGTPPTGFNDRPGGNAINIVGTTDNGGRVELNGGTILDATNDSIYIENSIATVQNMMITVQAVGAGLDQLDTDDGIQVVTTGTGNSIVLLRDNVIDFPVDDTNAAPTEDDLVGDNGIRLISNGTGTLKATVINNVIDTNDILAPAVDSIGSIHATSLSGTLNLNADSQNDGNGMAPTDPFLLENFGGTFNVTQASAGILSAVNNNVNVTTNGVITFGAATPPVPPPVMP